MGMGKNADNQEPAVRYGREERGEFFALEVPPEALVTRPNVEAFRWGIEQSDFLRINFAFGHR
jgi:hypothetical protein